MVSKISNQSKHYFLMGFFLVLVLGLTLLIQSLTFFLNGRVGYWQFPLALVLTVGIHAYVLFVSRWMSAEKTRRKYITLCLPILLVFITIGIADHFFDASEDGQEYHQEVAIQLVRGWNPHQTLFDEDLTNSLWINHYSKGTEIIQAGIYATTGKIETGKATNIMLLFASFLLSLSLLLVKISTVKAWLISILLALNPIVVVQVLTYYVDGVLASIFLLFIVAIILALQEKQWMHYLLITLLIILAFGVKFTAVVYMVLLMGAVFCWLLFNKQLKKHKTLIISFALGAVLGVLAGFNPYVTNTLEYEHPFYPLMGPEKVDIMTRNAPASFTERSRIERFFVSLFSHTDNAIMEYGSEPELKWPFTLNKIDIVSSGKVDTRIAGFGPLFSGIIVLAVVLFAILAAQFLRDNRFKNILFILITLGFTIAIIPESWWARYIPQFWYVPIVVLSAAEWLLPDRHKLLKGVIYVVLIANIGFSFMAIVQNLVITSQITHQLAILKDSGQTIVIDFRYSKSNRIRFEEQNIPYMEEVFDNNQEGAVWIIRSDARFLPPANMNTELKPPFIIRQLSRLGIGLRPWGGIDL